MPAPDASHCAVLTRAPLRGGVSFCAQAAAAAAGALRALAGSQTAREVRRASVAAARGAQRTAWRSGAFGAMLHTHRDPAAEADAAAAAAAVADAAVAQAAEADVLAAALAAPPWPAPPLPSSAPLAPHLWALQGPPQPPPLPTRGAALAATAAGAERAAEAAMEAHGWHAAEAALPGGAGVLALRGHGARPASPPRQRWD